MPDARQGKTPASVKKELGGRGSQGPKEAIPLAVPIPLTAEKPPPIHLASQSAVTAFTVNKEALEKTIIREEEKRDPMGWARVSLKAGAVALERRWVAHRGTIFDRGAAVGEAELGYTNNEAAPVVA